MHDDHDPDPAETQEWLGSIDALVAVEGPDRAGRLLDRVIARARSTGVPLDTGVTTDYVNTIEPGAEPAFPGDEVTETRIRHAGTASTRRHPTPVTSDASGDDPTTATDEPGRGAATVAGAVS